MAARPADLVLLSTSPLHDAAGSGVRGQVQLCRNGSPAVIRVAAAGLCLHEQLLVRGRADSPVSLVLLRERVVRSGREYHVAHV